MYVKLELKIININMRIAFFALIFLYFCSSYGQLLKGRTMSSSGEPLPFATLHIKGTTLGTTSNANGFYQLKLKEKGKYFFVVQHIGFQKIEKELIIDEVLEEDFILSPEVLELREVVVSSDSEDPAYRVIRKAIEKRKYYEKEVKAYLCDVYIKGVQRLDTFPDKIFGVKLDLDTGIVYLSESISELKFQQPNQINERMISSKVSGNNRAFSWNQASDMLINLYENSFVIDGLSERGFVSPIATNAMLFYDYELKGVIQEDDRLINKIKLLPKRKNDPVFDGYIYIEENTWRIHSVDALLVKSRGIEFVDSLTLHQVFARVENDIMMPFSQRFGFQFDVFKIRGSGYFNAIYSNYKIEPNYELINENRPAGSAPLFAKKEFTNEIMRVEEGSNEKDSAYWASVRPIPLSAVEIRDYEVKDSISVVKESKEYQDSVDVEKNKITAGKILLAGHTISRTYEGKRYDFPSAIQAIQYNTVEGFALDFRFGYRFYTEDDRMKYRISPSVRYGVSNEKFHAKTDIYYRKLDQKFTSFFGGGGRYVSQINESNPVAPFSNTVTALFFGESFVKLFEKGFVYGGFQQELVNGLLFTGRLEYANRTQLFNTADFSFSDSINFQPNQPINAELSDTSFPAHQALVADFTFRIRFGQKYQTRPDRRLIYKPKTPEIFVRYKKGLPVLGSDVNFDQMEISVTDDIRFGLVGVSEWHVSTGGFLNKRELPFINYQHFNGNRLWYARADGLRQFQLLDYYQYSTRGKYFEAHYEHHFNEFILNKVPLIRNLNWQTVASVHYLTTKAAGDYWEFGVGIEHIFKFLRIDYFRAVQNGQLDSPVANQAIRFGFGF